MLGRGHAENLFWTGRYIERAEDTARMLDVTYHGLLETAARGGHGRGADVLSVLRLDGRLRRAEATGSAPRRCSEFLVL